MADKMTYRQIVHKIIYDSGYAKEIADLIVRARKDPPDQDAIRELEGRFDPGEEELEEIRLSKEALSCAVNPELKELFATNPTFLLLDFARMYRP
jgi:hypothetical protein